MALTHQTMRRALAARLNDIGVYVISTSDTTSFTSFLASNSTAAASSDRLDGGWAYVANGPNVGYLRRTRPQGLTPSTGQTLIYPDWTPPAPGSEVEITYLFPPVNTAINSTGEDTDYRTVLIRSLERIDTADQITLATVAGQTAYSLAAFAAWLTGPDRLLTLYDPPYVTGYPPKEASWRVDRLDLARGTPTLVLRTPYATSGQTITVDVVRPASTLVNGTESLVGIVAEMDSVSSQVRLDDLLDVALWEAASVLAARGHDGQDWAGMAAAQEPTARAVIARCGRRARGLPEDAPPTPPTPPALAARAA